MLRVKDKRERNEKVVRQSKREYIYKQEFEIESFIKRVRVGRKKCEEKDLFRERERRESNIIYCSRVWIV